MADATTLSDISCKLCLVGCINNAVVLKSDNYDEAYEDEERRAWSLMAWLQLELWEEPTPLDQKFNEVRIHLQKAVDAETRGRQLDALEAAVKALADLQVEVRSELAAFRVHKA